MSQAPIVVNPILLPKVRDVPGRISVSFVGPDGLTYHWIEQSDDLHMSLSARLG